MNKVRILVYRNECELGNIGMVDPTDYLEKPRRGEILVDRRCSNELSPIGAKHEGIVFMSKKCKKDKVDEKDEKRSDAAYVCKTCGNSSRKEKRLCKPVKNK